ncbi:MAG: thioredoxin domain-containing protein [Alphaproteobacteria bacterium]|jgi:thioredoxin 1|nr:thioredoxin domain-containing protein [Alphaproteobacteria bacterium]
MSIEISAESFHRDVLSSPIPVLVVFFLDWSAPCRVLMPVIDELSGELSATIRIVKLDAEAHPSITKRYSLTDFPTLMIFKGGEVVASRDGTVPRNLLRAWIEQSV